MSSLIKQEGRIGRVYGANRLCCIVVVWKWEEEESARRGHSVREGAMRDEADWLRLS